MRDFLLGLLLLIAGHFILTVSMSSLTATWEHNGRVSRASEEFGKVQWAEGWEGAKQQYLDYYKKVQESLEKLAG